MQSQLRLAAGATGVGRLASATAADPHALVDTPPRGVARLLMSGKRRLAGLLGLAAAKLLRPSGVEFPSVRRALWQGGIAAQPKGFYSSLVDPADLPRSAEPHPCPGVRLNTERQHHYLTTIFPRFRDEFAELPLDRPRDWGARPRFFRRNDAFQNIDPLAYWGIIRTHRPSRIVELGSGYSTLLAREALAANGAGHVTAIDPFPREFIRRSDHDIELVAAPAEQVDPAVLLSLEPDDIVFVDSSHVVRQHGDVIWFFLAILPRLRDGVIVHVHDIHLPFDYPSELITQRNVYWTEQYLLQAYLLKNTADEVLFSSRFAAHVFPGDASRAFPDVDRLDGGSFWLRIGAAA
jgi:predicted O-methyltransferase YrrM